jgi:hypothetical protein
MNITIDCPSCTAAKRPLQPCAACGTEGQIGELGAWRKRLHAHSLSVILAEPRRDSLAAPAHLPRPLQIRLRLEELFETSSSSDDMIVPESVVLPNNPLSFDWDERRSLRRLRKSA